VCRLIGQQIDKPGLRSIDARFHLQIARGSLDPNRSGDGGQGLHGPFEDLPMEFLGSKLRPHEARHLLEQIVDLL
jgi:hypothetical protein